ncbi:acetoacetate decarboxylase family protein [Dethiosulfovibrio sp. F2B]|uniref:acetoacetate decarboxylase family protein n=1 Tax=Dethiosulfovibrio faecalis TaxID=2720018 RepID=UPI001F3FCC53|nr:acetoacetate decarboxylase family protein [Dethiosulfovibrio faecalis]MCF4152056.1 acetoacetate decarboxylase family protein [Dethiosulfovibrio faecalis]
MRGRFRFKDDFVYKMPVHFSGHPFYPVRVVYGDMTCISVPFEIDPESIARFVPEDFEILKPRVDVQYSNCRDVDWMAGGEYRLIQASVPVRYMGNGEGLVGDYVLVIWENKACPIIGGREEDGMPKLYADIPSERHKEEHWYTGASYEGSTFLSMDFHRQEEVELKSGALENHREVNFFGWRYIPDLGKGGAALSQATLYPQEMDVVRMWTGEGSLNWTDLGEERHPGQFSIIRELARLPVVRWMEASMFQGSARLNVADSRVLS